MNIVERAKNILIKPKDEWLIIDQETTSVSELVTTYLIPLSLIPAIASLIGFGIVSPYASITWGVKYAIMYFILMIAGAYVSAFIIDALAPNFGANKDFRKAMQLVTYSYTPSMVAGILFIVPALSTLASLAGLYGLYLLYLGIKPMTKSPEDKAMTYFIISLIVIILVWGVFYSILSRLLLPAVYIPIPSV